MASAVSHTGRDLDRKTGEGTEYADMHHKYWEKRVARPDPPWALAGSVTRASG